MMYDYERLCTQYFVLRAQSSVRILNDFRARYIFLVRNLFYTTNNKYTIVQIRIF